MSDSGSSEACEEPDDEHWIENQEGECGWKGDVGDFLSTAFEDETNLDSYAGHQNLSDVAPIPGLHVNGIPFGLPLSDSDAEMLALAAEPAPFGRRVSCSCTRHVTLML